VYWVRNGKKLTQYLTQKQQRTRDLTQVLDFDEARPGFEPASAGRPDYRS